MKTIRRDANDSHAEIRVENTATRVPAQYERQQFAAMDDLGLEDGDDALQYALMLSMEEPSPAESDYELYEGETPVSVSTRSREGSSSMQGSEVDHEAIAAVAEHRRREEEELQEMLEMIRVAEEREQGQ
jgi:hypothetical protein